MATNIVLLRDEEANVFTMFPQCFLLNQITVSQFVHIFDTISLFAAEFEDPKIGMSGKGLRRYLVPLQRKVLSFLTSLIFRLQMLLIWSNLKCCRSLTHFLMHHFETVSKFKEDADDN